MSKLNKVSARRSLAATINGIEPPALEYVEWEQFEAELEGVMQGGANKPLVMAVFSQAVNRARQRYHRAMVANAGIRPH
jgi:hypothetical protein